MSLSLITLHVNVKILINSRGVGEWKLHGNTKKMTQARSKPRRNPCNFD